MPSRVVIVCITVFWLAMTGWFFYRDIWPALRAGDQPPYTIDLASEVTGPDAPRKWEVFHNGETIGYLDTWVGHSDPDDIYEIHSHFPAAPPPNRHEAADDRAPHKSTAAQFGPLRPTLLRSTYWVNREGSLRGLDAEVAAVITTPVLPLPATVDVRVSGRVVRGELIPHWHVQSPLGDIPELPTDPVRVPDNHSMLTPLQPWNRLRNVQPNQRWRIRLFDPLRESVSAFTNLPQDTVPDLEAGVLEGTENLVWDNREVPCLVIEYRGKNITGRTYVRKSDGLVLRQEAVRRAGPQGAGDEERLDLERVP